jgi:HSP20 family protein
MGNLMTVNSPFLEMAKRFFDDDFDFYPSTFEARKSGGLSNVSENDKEYKIEVSAPGLKKKDIKIDLDENILRISSEVENKKEEKNDGYYRKEFCKTGFQRSFTLPRLVDKEKITASMEDGILNVSIPKIKEEKKDTIKIDIK